MTEATTTVVETPTESPKLSKEEQIQAAVNSPELSEQSFQLGDQTFKIIDLPYDDYLQFVSMLSPLLDAFISKLTPAASIPGINLDSGKVTSAALLKYCGTTLPEMVRIICSQTDPAITVETIKAKGKNPFRLAGIVMQQISRNNIIGDFADFFAQIAPLLRLVK